MSAAPTAHPQTQPTAGERLTLALAELGITAHTDSDAGNSWLVVNLDGDTFPGVGTAHLVAYVYEAHEDWPFVDQPMEHWAGTWVVAINDGRHERVVFRAQSSTPAAETAACAAFIADRLTASKRPAAARRPLEDVIAAAGITALRADDRSSTGVQVQAMGSVYNRIVAQVDGRQHGRKAGELAQAARMLADLRDALPAAGWRVVPNNSGALIVAPAR